MIDDLPHGTSYVQPPPSLSCSFLVEPTRANDPRDPVSESDRFVTAAREHVEVEYVRFEDEGHGVRHLRNRVHLYRRVADFLLRVLAP